MHGLLEGLLRNWPWTNHFLQECQQTCSLPIVCAAVLGPSPATIAHKRAARDRGSLPSAQSLPLRKLKHDSHPSAYPHHAITF